MKILCLADLHIQTKNLADPFYLKKQKRIFNTHLKDVLKDSDIVVIAGDIAESSIMDVDCRPLDALYDLFEKEVVFCLGNHEFAYKHHRDVIDYWKQWNHPMVHCLDVDGHFEKDGINFVGNVLWYDFTLNKNRTLMEGEIVDGWLDATIKDFDPIIECIHCKEQIISNSSDKLKNVLVTHMVPHIDLNTFSYESPSGVFNAYSGCEDFLKDLINSGYTFEYAICGHTHRRECKTIYDINCINIGNDYFFKTNTYEYMQIDLI